MHQSPETLLYFSAKHGELMKKESIPLEGAFDRAS